MTDSILTCCLFFGVHYSIPKHWFNQSPFLTMVFSALSAVFPEGEMGFVRSVRRYQSKISTPKLQGEVRAFIGQEAHHGNEHRDLNKLMASKGLPILQISDRVKQGIAWQEKYWSPERMLANTCALEHFTAIFAEHLLQYPELLDGVDERIKPLWMWHAIEESEHKAVAYDVYKNQVDNYWIRVSEMAITTGVFSFFTVLHTLELLIADRQLTNVRSIYQGMKYFLGKKGFLRGMAEKYLAYYSPNFHPNNFDSTHIRQQALQSITAYISVKAPQQVV